MKAKHLSAKEKTEGRTCCFEVAKNGVLGECRRTAAAKLGNSCLCLEHFEYASAITHDVEYVVDDKNIVKRAEFLESLTRRLTTQPAGGHYQGSRKKGATA